ncbi:substrate-binding domain-containing protein [Haloferula sp. A504]|uniref:substrate-binding domain-containing protein n=1 Tax=Haloferula sp. A504 TaxID=3373601 RepID=UPI0031C6DD00|nr:substrate-binding domain-containing protein [Verrucomicrobiaceae bacterium E54]
MKPLRIRSACEQVAEYLKEMIRRQTWTGAMPGENRLVRELKVGRDTARAALDQLEREGWLESQGPGRRRRIVLPDDAKPATFRVRLLLYSPEDRGNPEMSTLLLKLSEAGYEVRLARRSLTELGMKVERVARMVEQTEADAWVIVAASREVLEWFAARSKPAFGLFGRAPLEPLAFTGPQKAPAYLAAVRWLAALGHRRIVFLLPEFARKPAPDKVVQAVFDEMNGLGIQTGDYNLPDWKPSPEGLRSCLDSLFSVTPPTALFLDQPCEFIAAQQHLAERGILAPRDVSMICADDDPTFAWHERPVSCIRSPMGPRVNRVLRWIRNVATGKDDRRRAFTEAEFIEGGTIGPVPRGQ